MKKLVWIGVSIGILCFGAVGIWAGSQYLNNGSVTLSASQEFIIPQGASTKRIAGLLEEAGIIDNTLSFCWQSKKNGADGNMKAGRYTIKPNSSYKSLIQMFSEGIPEEGIKITIPEGYTNQQIGEYLEKENVVSQKDFNKALISKEYSFEFLQDIPQRENRLEGYLFPDTYLISKEASAKEIVETMLSRFEKEYDAYIRPALNNLPLDDVITIASMVEREIQSSSERPIAAGVIYNRLQKNMPLQMCSTIQYILGEPKAALTEADLKLDSPYNTYQTAGLPQGPIANPGSAAIKGALFPDENEYLYFVLKPDGSGEHYFTSDYGAFLDAKQEYKQYQ